MIGRWLRLASVLTLALAGTNALAVLAGQIRPAHPWLAEGRCAPPCWADVHPGRTAAAEAAQALGEQGYTLRAAGDTPYLVYERPSAACIVRLEFRGARVSVIRLRCAGLRLGDVVAALGAPDSVAPGATVIRFDFGRVRARFNTPACIGRFNPFTPVSALSLSGQSDVPTGASRWRGFQPLWRYRRLAPPTSGC